MDLRKRLLIVVGTGIAILAAVTLFARYYGDWLWFENLGFGRVFVTELVAKVAAFSGAFILFRLRRAEHPPPQLLTCSQSRQNCGI